METDRQGRKRKYGVAHRVWFNRGKIEVPNQFELEKNSSGIGGQSTGLPFAPSLTYLYDSMTVHQSFGSMIVMRL